MRTEKTTILQHPLRNIELLAEFGQLLPQASSLWLSEDDTFCRQSLKRALNLLRQVTAVFRIVQIEISHLPSDSPQLFRKVTHGQKNKGDLLFVIGRVVGF